ncbi:hypothetical protein SPRG_03101 [Saprolegnia parasitica CBS 223.65]|uniref:Elicitin n=1 Tax=Saprolegnia parasitica (strain CBS 223.65) TaxID=695850 RepID=A0A067CRL0_SAPPC|nr:hypothetical protein SPRG_03101 [Saprolegnia parasitica CBS 223.65]KDO31885.1 hypothetical protein SPRG_03101 [Saprolegnia parasitica CBS 223.65]|eukprot:XP_012197084.1 hypothetical protein SPRG_03101 [Saprolegnia parasitica CBS 223.65]
MADDAGFRSSLRTHFLTSIMKTTTPMLLALAAACVQSQDALQYDCDQGSVALGFGPIIGNLNDCARASGYNFVPVPKSRPTQDQLSAFCSVPECSSVAQKYLSIRLPVCAFDLDGQRVVAKDFFSTLCTQYANLTAPPTVAPTPAPVTSTKAPADAGPTTTTSGATTASVVSVVSAALLAALL